MIAEARIGSVIQLKGLHTLIVPTEYDSTEGDWFGEAEIHPDTAILAGVKKISDDEYEVHLILPDAKNVPVTPLSVDAEALAALTIERDEFAICPQCGWAEVSNVHYDGPMGEADWEVCGNDDCDYQTEP